MECFWDVPWWVGRGDLGVREGADPRTLTWVRANGINLLREVSRGADLRGKIVRSIL